MALKAQLRLRERRATPYDGQGMRESPVVPVELRPLPVMMGKAGQGSGKPLKGGVAHQGSVWLNYASIHD